MLADALELLRKGQNPDGGWGALAGKRSNTEMTAWAAMAMQSTGSGGDLNAANKAKKWLAERQNSDNSWPINDTAKGPSWATALAIIALSENPEYRERVVKAGNWALEQEGGKPGILADIVLFVTRQRRVVRLNEDLIGWPWTTANFSWIEPTSYFMLAVKKLKPLLPADSFKERIGQAELMIYDRMCEGGGWNAGNAEVYSAQLWPYPDITALALIATQEYRERKENQMSLKALDEMVRNADSGLALALAALCFSLYGQDSSKYQRELDQRFAKTQFLGETKALALAILALGDGSRFFRV